MNISTKEGDGGFTSIDNDTRVSKDSWFLDFFGTIDELQVAIGGITMRDKRFERQLLIIQEKVFDIYTNNFTSADVEMLENWIDEIRNTCDITYDFQLTTSQTYFIDNARVTTRRLERVYYKLRSSDEDVEDVEQRYAKDEYLRKYLNRLSDYFWMLGRAYSVNYDDM